MFIVAVNGSNTTATTATPPNMTICKSHKPGDFIPDPTDKHYYYECGQRGTAYRFKCSSNLIFNKEKNVCDFDPNVDKPKPTADPSNHSKTFSCEGKKDGFYPDEHDRHKFHECSGGYATDFQCPPTTVFIPGKNVCDHENAF